MKLTTYKYADVSTWHISKADAARLDEDGFYTDERNDSPAGCGPDGLIVYKYDTGWFVYVGGDEGERVASLAGRYSPALVRLVRAAHRQGAILLRLDAEGERHEGLVWFDWDVPHCPRCGNTQNLETDRRYGDYSCERCEVTWREKHGRQEEGGAKRDKRSL